MVDDGRLTSYAGLESGLRDITWLDVFMRRAADQPDRPACTFLRDGELPEAALTYGELDLKARAIASVLRSRLPEGERVLLVYPAGLDYVSALLGCFYAKLVCVPAYPPRLNRSLDRLEGVVADAKPALALTTGRMLAQLDKFTQMSSTLGGIGWLRTDDIELDGAAQWEDSALPVSSDTVALLQYTSGSGSVPKGVILTHGNLTNNQKAIQRAFGQEEGSIIVSWLPLYHDMGLIGSLLHTLYVGGRCILMSPAAFLQKPIRWLQAISSYRATTSGGPNFAYELCLRRIDPASCEGIDLSSWQVAFNGAEPVRPGTLERFARAFGAFGFREERFYPCYGLAESTLIVSGGHRGTSPVIKRVDGDALSRGAVLEAEGVGNTARELAGCGQVLDDQEVIVVDAESRSCLPAGVVGEIWVASKSVGHGYWGRAEETAATFGAYLKDKERGPFLRTGDLGFVADGELFVTGRVKDLIIIRGLNHYPQDVELSVETAYRQSRPGSAAAFSIEADGQECLVVVQEVDSRKSLDSSKVTMAIRESLARNHELDAYGIVLIRPGSLPRTSSGKVQRPKCKQLFLANQLEVVYQWTGPEFRDCVTDRTAALPEDADQQDIERWIREWVAARLGTQPDKIGSDQPLVAYGIDSLSALDFAHRCQEAIGTQPSTTTILESGSIAELACELTQPTREPESREEWPSDPQRRGLEYALSVGQQAIWFISQLSPSSAAYNLAAAMKLSGEIDVEALERACQAMVDRHAALRTTMVLKDGEVYQRIQPERKVDFDLRDASGWNDEQLQERLVAESRHQFDLLKGDCFRIRLFRRARTDHVMMVVVHHIIIDFWSLAIIARELGETYDAYRGNSRPALGLIRSDYGQYVRWQQDFIRSDEGERQSRYWQSELGHNLPLMRLPTDRMRLPVQSYEAGSVRIALAEDVSAGLARAAKEHGATLFMTLLGAFQVLLRRYTGQEDVIVGTPTAGRRRKQWSSVAGYFINPVVIRGRVEIGSSYGEILAGVKQKVLAALEHEDYPFALLVDKLAPARDLSRTPLFQVMFVLQRSLGQQDPGLGVLALGEAAPKIAVGSLELEGIKIDRRVGQFDLTLTMAEHRSGLFGSLQFNTQLFDRVTVERMALHYQTLLESIVRAKGESKAISLGVATKGEAAQILEQWNGAGTLHREGTTIQKMIEDCVTANRDRVALILGERFVSYYELNCRANRLAAVLIAKDAGPECVVAICINRSIEMVVAIAAVLKAGAAYLPLDPSSPAQRLEFMLQDARASILLTQSKLARRVSAPGTTVIRLDETWDSILREDGSNPGPRARSENLAYVIYTSGSTGKPKGVMLDQYNVINCFRAIDGRVGPEICGTWLAVTSISFDISVLELLWTLTKGFTVVVQGDSPIGLPFGRQARQRTDKNIEMSLFYFAADDQPAQAGKYKLLIEGAKFADRNGFNAIWTPERHFHPFGGLYPNPSVTSAAIATVTERIQLRAGSVVLPLHNPLRVVEEWSVVDNLSGGRVGISFASGWQPDDFVLAPDAYARRRDVFSEQIETVRKLWRGESIKSVGGDGREVEVKSFPRPIRSELPIWITAAGTVETFEMAGRVGAGLLTHLLGQDIDDLAQKIAIYRRSWIEHGHGPGQGHVTLMLHTFIGEDLEVVRETVRQPFSNYLHSSYGLMKSFARNLGQDPDALSEADQQALVDLAFDRYFSTSGLFGTPELCVEKIDRLKTVGVDEVACLIDFGVDTEAALASLDLLDLVRRECGPERREAAADLSIGDLISAHNVTHFQCTPSTAGLLVLDEGTSAALKTLDVLMIGGEALSPRLAMRLKDQMPGRLFNMYGPTEATIWCAMHLVEEDSERVPIGSPLESTSLRILEAMHEALPVGTVGELCIAGEQVARGYLNQPDLTAWRFRPDPFGSRLGERIYGSGDLARYRNDGTVEFRGRVDTQIKLMGHRIEMGEIETVLGSHPQIAQAAVTLSGAEMEEKSLAAYFVARDLPPSGEELRQHLERQLPAYMVPSSFVHLEKLPLMVNGKIDRMALPEPRIERLPPRRHAAPTTPVEEVLADIWQQVLRIEHIGVDDNFFDLGGNSLSATKLMALLSERFQVEVSLRKLFLMPTIRGFAEVVDSALLESIQQMSEEQARKMSLGLSV